MKTGTLLVATLALASIPLVAQQSAPETSPSSPPATRPSSPAGAQSTSPATEPQSTSPAAEPERTSPATEPERPGSASAAAATAEVPAPADLRAVKGELVSKLDTKTAKTGDDVVVQTKSAVKTADGTEIPKGSKLMGHVLAVQSSSAGQNSQVALQFDHAELTGGQSVPIQTQIQAIGSGGSEASSSGSSSGSSQTDAPPTSNSNPSTNNGASASANGATSQGGSPATGASSPGNAPTPSASAAGSSSGPAAGTVVARTGNIAIRATSIPGVLLANNEPGPKDPRMAQASSILLGAKKDVQLNSGTPMVVGIAASAGGGAATK